jgi:DNA-binding transcriptional MocR family regulator
MTIWRPRLGDGDEPVYLALVQALENDLAEGRLRPGDRLPPQRALARGLGVALGTVTRAYAAAERRGLAYGEVGRGTFAGRKPAHDRFGNGASAGIDLALAWPLYPLDPDLGSALQQVAGRDDVRRLLEYGPNAGHDHHRGAGSRWAELQGIAAEPGRVVITVGAQHAMTVALSTLLGPGDTLLTEPVTYPGLKAVAAALHVRLAPVPMDAGGIIPDALESACSSRRPRALYTIPTIQNPTASVLSEARRREIARIADRHGLAIIEDEVHRLLHPAPPPAFATLAPEITYSILSMSKVVTGGIRVAFLVTPPGRAERVAHTVWSTTWMAPPLLAEVAALWIGDGTAEATASRKRAEAAARLGIAAEILRDRRCRFTPNSYHVWLPLPGRWKAAEFALACERRGVLVSTSSSFAINRDQLDNAVRLSLSGPATREELGRGLAVVADVLESRAPGGVLL